MEDSYLSGPAGLGEMWSPGLGVGEGWSLPLNVLWTVPRGPLYLFTVTSKAMAPWCPGISPVDFQVLLHGPFINLNVWTNSSWGEPHENKAL